MNNLIRTFLSNFEISYSKKMNCTKPYLLNCNAHTELVSCVGWSSPEEVLSTSDDHQILKWALLSNESQVLSKLPDDVFPTDMHWFPRSGKKQAGSDVFALTSTDGEILDKNCFREEMYKV